MSAATDLLIDAWLDPRTRQHYAPGDFSASQFNSSNRAITLGKRAPTPVRNKWAFVRSNLGHALNDAIDKAVLALAKDIPADIQIHPYNETYIHNYRITGEADYIVNRRLVDLKLTSVFGYGLKDNDEYLWQLTVYRVLFPEVEDDADILYFLTDWSEQRAANDPSYPRTPFIAETVHLGDYNECYEKLRNRIIELDAMKDAPDEDIPLCTDKELWKSPDTYAYYAKGNVVGRATRVFESLREAQAYQASNNGAGVIQTRLGEPKACRYCKAATICGQFNSWNT